MANIFKIDRPTNTITLGTTGTIINPLGTFSKTSALAAGLNVMRVTGLQTDATALTGTLRGAYIDVSNGSLDATGTIRAMELKARTEAPGDTGNDVAVLEGLSISADSKGHSVTTMRAAEFILDGSLGGTITEAVGLRIANNLQADKATVSYGLQIYRDSFDYTYDISLSLGGHITGDSYVNQDLRTTTSPTFAGLTLQKATAISTLYVNCYSISKTISSQLRLRKSHSDSIANVVTIDEEICGELMFQGNSGSAFKRGISIFGIQNGNYVSTSIPMDLKFVIFKNNDTFTSHYFRSNGSVEFGGAISSATLTFSTEGPTDNVDVSGINTLLVDTSSNSVTIGGFAGGVDGQVLYIARTSNVNNVVLEHNEGGATQPILLHAGADETLGTEYGGWILICHGGTDWHDCSHAKHVV